jgi:hypothetical protein
MPLPQIDVPIYELQLVSKEQKIQYRPFLVKEKKILMIAAESKDPSAAYLAVKQIVNNCTFNKIDVEDLALFDLQYLFLNIRSKSIGEVSEFKFSCPKCKNKILSSINFEEIKITKDPNHDKKIMITDKIGIVMKYPNMQIEKLAKQNYGREELDLKVVVSCIDYVFDQEQVYYSKDITQKELEELIESLTEQQFKKISKFFDTLPSLKHNIPYACSSCGHADTYEVKDLYGFFA